MPINFNPAARPELPAIADADAAAGGEQQQQREEQQRQQPRQQKHQQEQLRLYQHKPQHKPTSRAPPESSDVPLKSIPDVVDAVTQQKLYKQLNGESQMQKKVLPLGVGVLCRSNEITIHNGMHT